MQNPSYFRVQITPSEGNIAALVLGVSALSEEDAIRRVRNHMEHKAVNHITKLAAAGVVAMDRLKYSLES